MNFIGYFVVHLLPSSSCFSTFCVSEDTWLLVLLLLVFVSLFVVPIYIYIYIYIFKFSFSINPHNFLIYPCYKGFLCIKRIGYGNESEKEDCLGFKKIRTKN